MKVKVEPDAEAKFVRKSLKSSIACLKEFSGRHTTEMEKDLKALEQVLDFYGG